MSTSTLAVAASARPLALQVESDGVAWLVFDGPGKVNILTSEVMLQLSRVLDEIEQAALAGNIKAVIIRSAKTASFIAGADINEIAAITDPAEGETKAKLGQSVFTRLSRLPCPTIAAIDGICLGGGTELVLACRYRLASDRRETRIGLPEVQLGILPGFGGSTRLPRLVGLSNALNIILTGKPVNASRAHRIGLIDERVPPAMLYERARKLARAVGRGEASARRQKRAVAARLLDDNPVGRRLVLQQARKRVLRETKGHYPAPLKVLDIMPGIMSSSVEEALALEAQAIGDLITTDVCKNLIHVYRLSEAAKKPPVAAPARNVERMAVLGAGVMGGGIAQLLAYRGYAVRLKDIKPEALALGLRHAWQSFQKAVQRKRLDKREAQRLMQRISPTLDYTGFGTSELVIEAVIERMDVKKAVLREAEAKLRAGAVLTSNTSSLSITEMQGALTRPADFCGMHFFNPVDRMPLVEIVRGRHSGEEALATVFATARKLEKTPVLVNDGPGFLVNRILAPYLNEAGWLLADGVPTERIDQALIDFGMPMGPLRLLDEIGLDVARHAAGVMYSAFGERLKPATPLVALGNSSRLGKKGGRGFYTYENGKQQKRDASIYKELGVQPQEQTVSEAVIVARCVFTMVNEAARVLEDGIVATPGDVDLGMIFGTGFPPFRGGLLRYADALGLRRIVQALELYTHEFGVRFEVAPLLRTLAAADRTFYGTAQ